MAEPHSLYIASNFASAAGTEWGAIPLLICAYLLGSIPFGLIIAALGGKGDIRKIGSGNIGATNVLRTGSKKLAALTLALDIGKGFAAVFIAMSIMLPLNLGTEDWVYDRPIITAAMGVVLGHVFPVWLAFKGGKGVATSLGVFWGLDYHIGLVASVTWLVVALALRYSSLAALMAMLSAIAVASYTWLGGNGQHDIYGQYLIDWTDHHDIAVLSCVALISGLVIFRHLANINRLIGGTEPKIGKS